MAHFAQIDENNIVTQVVVVSNDDLIDENGIEDESLGVAVCESVVGPGTWVQTSYNGNIRQRYAQVGFVYVSDADLFYDPVSPYPSWTLDENYSWQPPTPHPLDGGVYEWNEQAQTWDTIPTPSE